MAEACRRHKHKRTKKNVKRVLILITKAKSLHAQLNFCTFLCCHCKTATWKHLISRSIEGKTSHDEVNFSFWTWYGSWEFNPGRGSPNLTKLVSWDNPAEDWNNTNSPLQRRFRRRCRPPILKSLKLFCVPSCLRFACFAGEKTSFIAPKLFYEI